jgi:putative ABC transport system ATP-binding protein
MIELRNIERSYPVGAGRFWVLRRIDLEIKEGEFVTIMGPSGAGKSTLLAILGLLDGVFDGEYFLLGNAVHKLNNKKRAELNKRYIGFVFQQYSPFLSQHQVVRAPGHGGRYA